MTRCTIAIPVYNRAELVRVALDSALAQDAPGLEILVVDNCSDDGTWQVLQSYCDPRLRLVRNERNLGLFGNFNRCLELAAGRYLRFLCSDDRLPRGCIQTELELLERHPQAVLLSTRGQRVNGQGRILGGQADNFAPGRYDGAQAIGATLWFQLYYGKNPLNYPSGVLLRRAAALAAGPFDERLRVVGDLDFFFRVLELGDLLVLDRVGCEILVHGQQEGLRHARSGALVREFAGLIEQHHALLERQGRYASLRRQLPAYALWLALVFARAGLAPESRLHLYLAYTGGRLGSTALALGRIIGLRLLMDATGLRYVPMRAKREGQGRVPLP